jgi:predicted outer membrane repeat protein
MTTGHRIAKLFTALALLAPTAVAHAGGVVGTGTAASCTGTAFVQALAGGGRIAFDCGADLHTIVLPQRQTIAADTTIAGDDRIALSGGGTHGIFTVQGGRKLTLEGITLRDGGTENWAVYVSVGATLEATLVSVESCTRGGVYNAGGTVTVRDSMFADNDATAPGAAITNENGGTLDVRDSGFVANLNGAISSAGPTTIVRSMFSENRGDSAGGGAIVHSKTLQVANCLFERNEATAGGAIYTSGDLVVEDSLFVLNTATLFEGGAIQLYNQTQTPSSVTVRRSTFQENLAARSGGAVRCDAPVGSCTFENVTFSLDGAGTQGGAAELSIKSGTVQVTHATVLASATPAIERVAGTLTVRNSVIDEGGCSGGLTDGGGNVQGEPGLCAPGFQSGDPALLGLQDNGGLTPTHEIGVGSAARQAAAAGCLPTDQRGVTRPATGCDAGAFQRGAVPTLTALEPSRARVGGPSFTMTVRGSSFLPDTILFWNGAPLPITVVSPTEITVAVPAELIATVGVATVTVENPNPPVPDGGQSTGSLPFTIDDVVPPPDEPPPGNEPPPGPCDALTDYAAVLCALEQARTPGHFCAAAELDPKLDKPLQKALSKAMTLVTAARDASAKRRARLLRRARTALAKVAKRAASKRAGKTSATCKTAISGGTNELAADVAGLGA